MRRLVASWVEAEKEYHGLTRSQAIERLSDVVGINVTHSRLSEWCRGKYCPQPAVLSEMLYRAFPWILGTAGIQATKAQMDQVDNMLWKIEDGIRYYL